MAGEADFNDVIENIFLREETQHKESYDEGFKAGTAAGNPEGYHLGYHRGAELGRELGFYYGIVNQHLETNKKSETKYSEKIVNQLNKVKDLLDAFPRENCEDQDILGMAENIRAHYKKACALLKISSVHPFDAGMSFFLKMDSRISRVRQKLDSTIRYLTPLLPLANCHMVEFLTHNHWQKMIPKALTESLEHVEFDDTINNFWRSATEDQIGSGDTELDKWVKNARTHCLQANNDYCLTREQLQDRIRAWGGEIKPDVKVKEFMSSKKSYEVQTMCGVVASLFEASKSTCCVEVGGGRGPLLAALSLAYGVPSITVDCDLRVVTAAERRSDKMKKLWHAIAQPVEAGGGAARGGGGGGGDVGTSGVGGADLHRFAPAFVTARTDLAAIARDLFPELGHDVRLLLTGLHTCGSLGAASLRVFAAQAGARALATLPCCYHLLAEREWPGAGPGRGRGRDSFQRDFGDAASAPHGEPAFPMSLYLNSACVSLGRNARMLAAQSLERVASARQLPPRSLLYRAMLQVVISEHPPAGAPPEGRLKRASKCDSFEQYFKMADSLLQLNLLDTIPDAYFKQLNKDLDENWKKLVLFYLLRLCLAQVVESVILLDRLLYLMENGFDNAFIVKLFDPVLSPRCHSIVAIRE